MDPERDTSGFLAEWTTYLPENLVVATGTPAAIRRVAGRFGVEYERIETTSPAGYTMSVSGDVFLVDETGSVIGSFPFGTSSETFVDTIEALGSTPEPDESPLITPEPTPAPTPGPTPFPSSEESLVGDFMCLELAITRDLLEDEGLLVGATYPDPPPEETWVVQDQLPKPGESVTVGTKVDLMLAEPQEPCPPG